MIVEAKEAVPWTKPQDVAYDPLQPVPPLGGMFHQGFHGATFDGAGRLFFKEIEDDQPLLRALIGADDGIEVDFKPYIGSLR